MHNPTIHKKMELPRTDNKEAKRLPRGRIECRLNNQRTHVNFTRFECDQGKQISQHIIDNIPPNRHHIPRLADCIRQLNSVCKNLRRRRTIS